MSDVSFQLFKDGILKNMLADPREEEVGLVKIIQATTNYEEIMIEVRKELMSVVNKK